MHKSSRKIMSYPFSGLDYQQIVEIGNRVRLTDNDMLYLIPYTDPRFGMKQERTVIISDEKIKCTLYYFKFLSDMCNTRRVSEKYSTYSNNTFVDTILISANEIISHFKCSGVTADFNELLGRFGKRYDKNDLFRLYHSSQDYSYLNDLFEFLCNDSYLICFGRNNNDEECSGISFDMVQRGNIDSIVNSIIDKKDNIDELVFDNKQTFGPRLTKKISDVQVI